MVYRGRISAACLSCRQRRIKCDQLPEGCSPCRRSKIACTGYRSTESFRVCDQTGAVVAKYHGLPATTTNGSDDPELLSAAGSSSNRDTPDADASSHSSPNEYVSGNGSPVEYVQEVMSRRWLHNNERFDVGFNFASVLSIPNAPNITLDDDFAVAVCLSEFLPPQDMITVLEQPDGPLLDCFKAIGMATFADLRVAEQARMAAKRHYASAISKTNAALSHSDQSQDDKTLVSVMILSNLETLLGTHEQGFDKWSVHIQGSAALMAHRGETQLENPRGRELFLQAATNIVCNCLWNGIRVPQILHTLTSKGCQLNKRPPYEDVIWTIHSAFILLADLYSDTITGHLTAENGGVEQILELDRALAECVNQHGCICAYRQKISKAELNDICDQCGILSAMCSLLASQCCSFMFNMRIVLHFMILKLLRGSTNTKDSNTTVTQNPQFQCSSNSIQSLQDAVLGSVANEIALQQHLYLRGVPTGKLFAHACISNSIFTLAHMKMIKVLSGAPALGGWCGWKGVPAVRLSRSLHVITTLLIVSQVSKPNSPTREEVRRLLRVAGSELDIEHAFSIADSL